MFLKSSYGLVVDIIINFSFLLKGKFMTETIKKKNPWVYFIGVYINYNGFKGRANRAEYWWFRILFFIFSAFLITLLTIFSEIENNFSIYFYTTITIVWVFWWMLSIVPLLSLAVRRMHDCNKNGFFLLIPVYSWILLHFVKGTSGLNRFDLCKEQTETEKIISQNRDSSKNKKHPLQYFINPYKNYMKFEGRANRAEYWWFHYFFFIFSAFLSLIQEVFLIDFDYSRKIDFPIANIAMIILAIWWLLSIIPLLSLAVRRMHDCNKHGAYLFIPIYGWIILPLTKGTSGLNRFDLFEENTETNDIILQRNNISAAICKECREPVSKNYCQNCGSPVSLEKIDHNYFINEIKSVLGVQNRLFYSLKRLLVFPGISARQYINDNRNNFVKPLIYLFFTALLFTISYNIVSDKHTEFFQTEITTKYDEIINFTRDWMESNAGYSFLIISFICSFMIKRVFRKYKYNIYEILVLMCFLNGTLLIIRFIIGITGFFLPLGAFKIFNYILYFFTPIYYIWGIASFFDNKKYKNYVKAFFVY